MTQILAVGHASNSTTWRIEELSSSSQVVSVHPDDDPKGFAQALKVVRVPGLIFCTDARLKGLNSFIQENPDWRSIPVAVIHRGGSPFNLNGAAFYYSSLNIVTAINTLKYPPCGAYGEDFSSAAARVVEVVRQAPGRIATREDYAALRGQRFPGRHFG
jgi:hypothetical protein